MYVKKVLTVVILGLIILAGCKGNDTTPMNLDEIVALTAEAAISAQQSAVPVKSLEPPATNTPEAPVITQTAPSSSNASITITSIQETGYGKAIVNWDAVGDFPSGFKLVWTTEVRQPVFPGDTNSYTSDPFSRSMLFSGTPGTLYLMRVCRFTGDACDVYSNLGIFSFSTTSASSTPLTSTKTVWPTTRAPGGGGTGGKTATPVSLLTITSVTAASPGKALMMWKSDTNPSKGFKLVYSKTNSVPIYGTDSYYAISDGATRQAYVDGTSGTKYYYRICMFDGTKCNPYSPVYTFTFPTFTSSPTPSATTDPAVINITGLSDLSAGAATINWTASGTFSNGFKILYSTSNSTPTLGGSGVSALLFDGALRSAIVNGVPRSHYYYRICKYTGSTCSVYSNVVEFTYADISEDPAIELLSDGAFSEAGKVKLDWTLPADDNAGGYLILQAYPDTPIFPEAVKYTVSDPTARTFTVSGLTSGLTYNFRLCLYNGSICTVYSAAVTDVLVP